MKIVLLPGLDGTEMLFKELIKYLPKGIKYQVINLDTLSGSSYPQQAVEVARKIDGENFLLVAESYSGRIAYKICLILGKKIKKVVFLASFISPPSHTSKATILFSSAFFKENTFLSWGIRIFGFNFANKPQAIKSVFDSLAKTEKNKLRARLQNIASLDIPDTKTNLNAIYIRPSHDLLVSNRCVKAIERVFRKTQITEIKGGHFIAQSNPRQCAQIIYNASTQ